MKRTQLLNFQKSDTNKEYVWMYYNKGREEEQALILGSN